MSMSMGSVHEMETKSQNEMAARHVSVASRVLMHGHAGPFLLVKILALFAWD